ncbi:iron uptake transporter permease EfeU [Nigerium massiliense]|uniref:iron uptake transporter permease EfeU n=1 Tax=Nigerium massiliense TaxID=1522317 RepID=UPI0009079937|nr:iron uptake transporter permease EfeU [Nigerium massiliense]
MLLANFLIALREGVEAALIVGILVGFLVKMNRRDALPALWLGVVIAVVLPFGAGAAMIWGPYSLTFEAQETIGGTLSIIAAGFVTWMIFWMGRNSRQVSLEVGSSAAQALEKGSSWALVWLAILSVGREGVETAVFVWGVVRSSAHTAVWEPVLGVAAGLVVATVIGWLIYRGSRAINLRAFFAVTGFLLIFVAAGIVLYGLGDLQEAGVLPGWGVTVYDASGLIVDHAGSLWFVLLNAFFGVQYLLAPTHLQLAGYLLYLIPVLVLFTRQLSTSGRRRAAVRPTPGPATSGHGGVEAAAGEPPAPQNTRSAAPTDHTHSTSTQ